VRRKYKARLVWRGPPRAFSVAGVTQFDLDQPRNLLFFLHIVDRSVVGCGSKSRKHGGLALLVQISGMLQLLQQ
jgi:hypothetical protein